jgi:predicted metal-dependent hydrolase
MNTSHNTIELGDICLDVIHKDIKNVHLSVHPPNGRVTISAPRKMDLETIRLFSISKLGWIRKQQAKFENQKREAPREYVTRESHYYLGQRYLLKVYHSTERRSITGMVQTTAQRVNTAVYCKIRKEDEYKSVRYTHQINENKMGHLQP